MTVSALLLALIAVFAAAKIFGELAERIGQNVDRFRRAGAANRGLIKGVLENDVEQLNELVYSTFGLSSLEREMIERTQAGHRVE